MHMCFFLLSLNRYTYLCEWMFFLIFISIHICACYMFIWAKTCMRVNIYTYICMLRSPDGDTEYFNIVAGIIQWDTLALYLFIICLDYVLRTSIDKIRENGFGLTKKRSRRYPTKTITDADYADDIAILANTPNQAETLLHGSERATACISLHVNAQIMESYGN